MNIPAFPTTDPNYEQKYAGEGMSLRDYFAAKALATREWKIKPYDTRKSVAEECYMMADALLEARK